MTEPTELLPCPFCGAAAHFEMDEGRWEWVECESCGMQGNRSASLMEDCKPKLVEAWNRRTPSPVGVEPVAWRVRRLDSPNYWIIFLHKPVDALMDPEREVQPLYTAPQPTQAQAGSVTADDLKQPRNGAQWRVEWWNESCRMLLPANKRLDSCQTYRNGTLMFTIKEKSGIKGGQHGAE